MILADDEVEEDTWEVFQFDGDDDQDDDDEDDEED